MNYRVLTISREYGSGGAQIAKLIAQRIGWELLDSALVDTVARAAQVDIGFARENDERSDSFNPRIVALPLLDGCLSQSMRQGADLGNPWPGRVASQRRTMET